MDLITPLVKLNMLISRVQFVSVFSTEITFKTPNGSLFKVNREKIVKMAPETCQQYTTIVGGQVFWRKGRNYVGNILAGIDSTATVSPSVLIAKCRRSV